MAFADGESVIQEVERLVRGLWQEKLGLDTEAFPRMTYSDAMARYGSDKPDTRLGSKVRRVLSF
jgi:aspartyl-tRNA synthetase